MLRLIVRDLLANARVWLGALVVVIASGFVGGVTAGFIETGNAAGGLVQTMLSSLGGVIIAFTTIAAIVVLSSVANLTVALQRRGYALWQLVGMRPALVGWVVMAQLVIVSVVGALIGCAIAVLALPWIPTAMFGAQDPVSHVPVHFDVAALVFVTAGVTAVVLLGGVRGARRASRVPPIEALRESDPPRMRAGWLRWIIAVVTLGGVLAMSLTLPRESFNAINSEAVVLAPLFAAPLAALGPLVFPIVLRAWTALLPRRVSASWFLARHSAGYRLSLSSAAVGPLMVAVALAGGLYTTLATLAEYANGRGNPGDYDIPLQGTIAILGGPLVLCGVGVAATVFMSGRAREREFALIRAAGSTDQTVLAMAAWEAVIYAVTAVILGAVAIVAGGTVLASALHVGLAPAFVPPAIVAGGGLVLLLVATVVPSAAALRHDLPRALAAE